MKQMRQGQEQRSRVGGELLLCIVVVYKSIFIGCRMSLKLMLFDKLSRLRSRIVKITLQGYDNPREI